MEGANGHNDSKDIFYAKYIYSSAQIFRYNIVQDRESQITNNRSVLIIAPDVIRLTMRLYLHPLRIDYGISLVISDQDGSNQQVIVHKDQIFNTMLVAKRR